MCADSTGTSGIIQTLNLTLENCWACVALAHRSSVFILSVYKVLRVSASPLADKMEINPHPSLCSCLHTQLHQYILYYLSTTLQTALMSI